MGLAVAVGAAAAISATTVLESVAVVGAVVGAVGAVTHNKALSMIGLGLGIVGGVGALATSALGVGSAAVVGGSAGSVDAGAAAGAAGATDAAGGAVTTMDAAEAAANPATTIAAGAASGAAPDIVGDLSAAVPSDVPTTMDAAEAAASPSGLLNSGLAAAPAGGDVNLLPTTSESANPADVVAPNTTGTDTSTAAASGTPTTATNPSTAANPVPQPTGPGTTEAVPNGTGGANPGVNLGQGQFAPGAEVTGVPSGSAAAGGPSTLSNIIDYVGKHPVLAMGALQAGGSLLSGLTSTLTPAQVSALNAQAAANNAAAALTSQQAANLNMPKSVASSAPVTGAPTALVPGQAGLINRASQPVTGVAA